MNDSALHWLTNRASPSGTLGCGLRRPDGDIVCHSVEEVCPVAVIEKILGCFESHAAVRSTDLPAPRWSTWAFEKGQVRFVERQDGWCLALVILTESAAAPALDSLSLEFLSLPLDK